MDRIVTQIGKREEALKKIRKIKISVTTREILVAAGVAQPARADGCNPAAAVCPLCQRDMAEAGLLLVKTTILPSAELSLKFCP